MVWLPPPGAVVTAGRWLLLLLANPNLLLFFKKLGVRVENKTLFLDAELYKRSTLMRKPAALMAPAAPLARARPAPLDYGKLIRPIAAGGLLAGAAVGAIRSRGALPNLLGLGSRAKLPALIKAPPARRAANLDELAPAAATALAKGLRASPAAPPVPLGPPSISSKPRSAALRAQRTAAPLPTGLRAAFSSQRAMAGYLSMLALSAGLMKPAWEHVREPSSTAAAADGGLSSWPLVLGSLLAGHCADRYSRPAMLRFLAAASAASLFAAGVSMQAGVAKLARAAEAYAMLALPVVQAAVADGTLRLLDRSRLFGLLTAASALCMIGGSAATVALLHAAGIGPEPADAGSEAAQAAAAVVRVVVLAAATTSLGALFCTAFMRGEAPALLADAAASAAAEAQAGEEGEGAAEAHNYRLTTPASAPPAPPAALLGSPQLVPTWLYRGQGRRGPSRISPSVLAASMLALTTLSNPGTFSEVWDGVYNWHRLGGEPLHELAKAALLLVVVQAFLLKRLARLAGGTHRLLSLSHVGMAFSFLLLMKVEGGNRLSYPLFGLFLAAHSLVDSLTATLVSAYAPAGKQACASLNGNKSMPLPPPRSARR
ncbi:hypothetical protein T492DRAFT_837469 [Pavlovales sp. CCMP2436]|nr:hypothetical protein T492DRAFT_837469 [Pavlovales sp. CCMP2436]